MSDETTKTETREERRARILRALNDLATGRRDKEDAHHTADHLLLELIDDDEISAAWEDIPKWFA